LGETAEERRAVKLCAAVFALLLALWADAVSAASFDEGLRAFRAGQPERARDIWLPLAEAGDAAAQYSLGKLFEQGEAPVAQDLAAAVRWYREAAAQHLPAAQNNLALMYAKGRGVEADPGRAIELWSAASEQGYPWAQYNLGLAYFRGQGVPKEERQAAVWFRKAADGGLAQAQFIMGQLKREGLTLKQDSGEALTWYRRAVKNGDLRAKREVKALEAAGIEAKRPGPPEIELGRPAAPTEAQPAADGTAAAAKAPTPLVEGVGGATAGAPAAQPAPAPLAAESEAAPEPRPAAQAEPPAPAPRKTEKPALAKPKAEAAAAPEPVELPRVAPEAGGGQSAALPAAPAAPGKSGRFRVWLASADSDTKAASIWRATRDRHPEIFSGSGADFSRVELGGGKALFRILVGPLDSRAAAKALCDKLRAVQSDAFCKVQSE
jgi:TPR repeat protein